MTTTIEHDLVQGGRYPTGSEEWAARVRRRAQNLNAALETGYMELASLLYLIYDTPIDGKPENPPVFRAWGYESWEEWVDKELNLKPEKARYLRRIHYVLNVELKGLPPATLGRLAKLGLSKVGKLLRVLTVSNAERWCDMAAGLSNRELDHAIQDSLQEAEKRFAEAAMTGGDEEAVQPEPLQPQAVKWRSFALFTEQQDTVGDALKRAMELSNSTKPSHNLTLICMDFLANNDFRYANDAEMQMRYLAKLEALFGKKLVLVDPVSKEVEYGMESLQMLVPEESHDNDRVEPRHDSQ